MHMPIKDESRNRVDQTIRINTGGGSIGMSQPTTLFTKNELLIPPPLISTIAKANNAPAENFNTI